MRRGGVGSTDSRPMGMVVDLDLSLLRRSSSSASSTRATKRAKMRWYSVSWSDVEMGVAVDLSRNKRGVMLRDPERDVGVGVEAMKGSADDADSMLEVEWGLVKEEDEGRSWREGGVIPSSVYSQSI